MKKILHKYHLLFIGIILISLFFAGKAESEAAVYKASANEVTTGDSFWHQPVLKMKISNINGSKATFTISKIDGEKFKSSGDMYLKVGTYKTFGVNHGVKKVYGNDTYSLSFEDDFDKYPADTYPKRFYARFQDDSKGTWAWVGPITITRMDSSPSGNIISPSGMEKGNITIKASASDADGLKKVSVVFVPYGKPLALCEDGTSNPCSGTSGQWTVNNVNPEDYGVNGPGEFTLGLWVRDETNDTQLADKKTVSWSYSNSFPSGNIISPSGMEKGNITIKASASDADGLKKVSVVFVKNGPPLALCEDGTSNPCSGTSGQWIVNNVNPEDYGAYGGSITIGLHVQDDNNGNNETLADSETFTWIPANNQFPTDSRFIDMCVGHDYEQQMPVPDVNMPYVEIINGPSELRSGKTVELMTDSEVDINNGGSPFFYWCTDRGKLEYDPAHPDKVKFTAPFFPGYSEDVNIFVQIGDTLGYIDTDVITVKVKGSIYKKVYTKKGVIFPDDVVKVILPLSNYIGKLFAIDLKWPGSDIDIVPSTPDNREIDYTNENVVGFYEGNKREYYVIYNDMEGEWSASLVPVDVNPDGEPYELVLYVETDEEIPGGDSDNDGLPDAWEMEHFGNLDQDQDTDFDNDGISDGDEYNYGLDPTSDDSGNDDDGDGYSNIEEINAGTDPTDPDDYPEPIFESGIFTVGSTGKVAIDFLFDGGGYVGELAVFNIEGMDKYEPNSREFVAEALRRALSSDPNEGFVAISDSVEAARFSGYLGDNVDFNHGRYVGTKEFNMKPGTKFAIYLIPDGTVEEVAQNPGTSNPKLRPLFSLASSNADHNMYMGQVADLFGTDRVFSYEDLVFSDSDFDFDDVMFSVTGAASDIPSLDELIEQDIVPGKPDWFDSDLGHKIWEHGEKLPVKPEEIRFTLKLPDSVVAKIETPDGNFISIEDGSTIAGGLLKILGSEQFISLPTLPSGFFKITFTGNGPVYVTAAKQSDDEKIVKAVNSVTIDVQPNKMIIAYVDGTKEGPVDFIYEEPVTAFIKASAGEYGKIEPSGNVGIEIGKSQVFRIIPEDHCHIKDVIVDGESKGAIEEYTFEDVNNYHEIKALFEIEKLTVTIIKQGDGEGTLSEETQKVPYGSDFAVSATPLEGSVFAGWSGDASGTGLAVIKNITSDKTIIATFNKKAPEKVIITANSDECGEIVPNGAIQVEKGNAQTFAINAKDDCHIIDVVVDGKSKGAISEYTFENISENHEIKVVCVPVKYMVTVSKDGDGNGSVSHTSASVNCGSDLTITATPDNGSEFAGWQGDFTGKGNNAVLTNIRSDMNLVAVFRLAWNDDSVPDTPQPSPEPAVNKYNILASSENCGTIEPSGNLEVSEGDDISFSIISDEGCVIEDVIVDGESKGDISSYTFSNINENHEIKAVFAEKVFVVNVIIEGNGSVSGSQDKVKYGSDLVIKAIPAEDSRFAGWSGAFSGTGDAVLKNITSDIELIARFEPFEQKEEETPPEQPDSDSAGNSDTGSANEPPVADAGENQTVDEATQVILDGSASYDPDDGIAQYVWEQLDGTIVDMEDADKPKAVFTSPEVGVDGETLKFRLTVTDKYGLSDSDTTIVNVTYNNEPPVAVTEEGQTINSGEEVVLDGSKSYDPDGEIVRFTWAQTSGPEITLEDNSVAKLVFTAPDVEEETTVEFTLEVEDDRGLMSQSQATITIIPAQSSGDTEDNTGEGGGSCFISSAAQGFYIDLAGILILAVMAMIIMRRSIKQK